MNVINHIHFLVEKAASAAFFVSGSHQKDHEEPLIFNSAWFFKVKVSEASEVDALLSAVP